MTVKSRPCENFASRMDGLMEGEDISISSLFRIQSWAVLWKYLQLLILREGCRDEMIVELETPFLFCNGPLDCSIRLKQLPPNLSAACFLWMPDACWCMPVGSMHVVGMRQMQQLHGIGRSVHACSNRKIKLQWLRSLSFLENYALLIHSTCVKFPWGGTTPQTFLIIQIVPINYALENNQFKIFWNRSTIHLSRNRCFLAQPGTGHSLCNVATLTALCNLYPLQTGRGN